MSSMGITARLNSLTFDDADEIRALFSQLIGKEVDESFLLIPPFYTQPAETRSPSGVMSSSIRTALFMIWAASTLQTM
jgi:hypothetical protein